MEDHLKPLFDSFVSLYLSGSFSPKTIMTVKRIARRISAFCMDNGIREFDRAAAERFAASELARADGIRLSARVARQYGRYAFKIADYSRIGDSYRLESHNSVTSYFGRLSDRGRRIVNEFVENLSKEHDPGGLPSNRNRSAKFVFFAEEGGFDAASPSKQDVLDYLIASAETCPNSMDDVVYSLRLFLRFCKSIGRLDWDPEAIEFRLGERRRKVPVVYSSEEIDAILSEIDRTTPAGKRDYAAILLSLTAGLRSCDVRGLRIADIDWERSTIDLVQSKTGRRVILPLHPAAGNAIIDYVENGRPRCGSEFVFLSHRKGKQPGQMGKTAITMRLRGYIESAGVEKAPNDGKDYHAFRKTYATRLLESGETIESVASALGDAGLQSVKPYLSLDTAKLSLCAAEGACPPCGKDGLHA